MMQNGNALDLVFDPNGAPQVIPEPGTWVGAALLLGAAGYARWRRRAKVS
ncbi:MAG: PEP-CTERM sorting domain-containing protein [Chthoniobacterales bacterium]